MRQWEQPPYGKDTGLRIVASLLRHTHYHFKSTCEVNQDADVWWTEERVTQCEGKSEAYG